MDCHFAYKAVEVFVNGTQSVVCVPLTDQELHEKNRRFRIFLGLLFGAPLVPFVFAGTWLLCAATWSVLRVLRSTRQYEAAHPAEP